MTSGRLVLAACAVLVGSSLTVASRADTGRTVYVAGIDSKGNALDTLIADDLSVTVDGQPRPITKLIPATDPIDLAILDDDHGNGLYAPAIGQLIQTLGDRARYSIGTFTPALVEIAGYTTDTTKLRTAVQRLGRRGTIDNAGRELETAILDVAAQLKQQATPRHVIVVFTMGGEGTAINPSSTMDDLAESGAMLNVVFQAAARLGPLTSDGPDQSGGRLERILGEAAAGAAVARVCQVLLRQYALTYAMPERAKSSGRIRVSTTRKGVTLLAPTRVPAH